MNTEFYDLLMDTPVIAAVKSEEGLEKALKSESQIVFFLFGDICNVDSLVDRVKAAGRLAIVNLDFISGLGSKEVAAEFIKKHTNADGIISTKPQLVRHAKELGLIAIQRTFVVDSIALANLKKQLVGFKPDAVEIMPGVMPKVLKIMREYTDLPIIASGLLTEKKDIITAFDAGADAVSTTDENIWNV